MKRKATYRQRLALRLGAVQYNRPPTVWAVRKSIAVQLKWKVTV